MTVIIRCECEAVYERTEIEITDPVEVTVDCRVCGHELNSWRGNKLLCFELIKNPTE